jgi:hypothetical protein
VPRGLAQSASPAPFRIKVAAREELFDLRVIELLTWVGRIPWLDGRE